MVVLRKGMGIESEEIHLSTAKCSESQRKA